MKTGKLIVGVACLLLPAQSLLAQRANNAQGNQPVTQPQYADQRPAPPPRELPPAGFVMQQTGGSLMRAGMATSASNVDATTGRARVPGFFAVPEPVPRTIKKHDLVTIVVREESEFESDGSTDTKKDMNLDASIDEFIKLDQLIRGKLKGGGVSAPKPQIALGASRDFKGEAKVDRSDSFITRIQAEVVDVKPNGTFALQARKRIKIDEEEQEFILTGIARGGDVTVDNTVLSTQVHDLVLEKYHRGAVRDGTKRGALPKLLDAINPF